GRRLALACDDRVHGVVLLRRRNRVRVHEHRDEPGSSVTKAMPGRSDRDQVGTQPGDEAHARRLLYRPGGTMTTKPRARGSAAEPGHERGGQRAAVDQLGRPGHPDRPVVADLDPERAAVHADRHRGVGVAQSDAGGGHRAGAAARGQRLARATLPDPDTNAVARVDPGDLDVRAARKQGMVLQGGAEAPESDTSDVVDEDHTVRIADIDRGDPEGAALDHDAFLNDLSGRAGARDLLATKGRRSHVDGDLGDAPVDPMEAAPDDACRSLDGEGVAGRAAFLCQPAREDAKPVPALLSFAAVGVEDTQPRVGTRRRDHREDPVAADAAMAVAEPAHRLGSEWKGEP